MLAWGVSAQGQEAPASAVANIELWHTFAVDSLDVDYNEQAAKSAESYLDNMSFSRSGLIEQLEFEGYTTEQATYGVDQTGL